MSTLLQVITIHACYTFRYRLDIDGRLYIDFRLHIDYRFSIKYRLLIRYRLSIGYRLSIRYRSSIRNQIAYRFFLYKIAKYLILSELADSLMYLYRATGDLLLLQMGAELIEAIEHSSKTSCGYAMVNCIVALRVEKLGKKFFELTLASFTRIIIVINFYTYKR